MSNSEKSFWGIPRVFSKECANGLFYCGCEPLKNGSAVLIEIAGVAGERMSRLAEFCAVRLDDRAGLGTSQRSFPILAKGIRAGAAFYAQTIAHRFCESQSDQLRFFK